MTKIDLKIFTLLLSWLLPVQLLAQAFIYPSGTLRNEKGEPFDASVYPRVLFYDTEAEAKEDYERLNAKPPKQPLTDHVVEVDEAGYFAIEDGVSEAGWLIFFVDNGTPKLEKINGRKKIDVKMSGAINLKGVTIDHTRPDKPVEIVPVVFDKWIRMQNMIPVPQEMAQSNYRLIFQPYLLEYADGKNADTIEWCRPVVADGSEFHATQKRRMGFDMRNDKLNNYLSPENLASGNMVMWRDSVEMPNPRSGKYRVFGITNMEDYSSTVYYDNYVMVRGLRRPLKYLEVAPCTVDLDPMKQNPNTGKYLYVRNPQKESHSSDNELHLTFLYNSPQLDPVNPKNEQEMNLLISSLTEVFRTKGASVREVRFVGISSPEGSYQGNISLSRARIATVKNAVVSRLSAMGRANFVAPEEAGVAPWDSVVPLLQKMGYYETARKVEEICNSTTNHDMRSNRIAALDDYESVVKSVFPQLRKVTCHCRFEIFRKPTDKEILQSYNTDPAYHNGTVEVPLYEYGRLFELLKDSVPVREMEALYKRALDLSFKLKRPWHLPANLLATSYLQRDTVDLNVLRPFLDFKGKINQYSDLKNMEELWANQMLMYMKAYEGDTARFMAQELEKAADVDIDNYDLPLSFANQAEFQTNQRVLTTLLNSSPQNKVVMFLAMSDDSYDQSALEAWKDLDQSKAVTWYLRSVIESRIDPECENEEGHEALLRCRELDERFYEESEFDADLSGHLVSFAKGPWLAKQKSAQ
ncbi:MAG: hypothetical protein Q4B58_00625 [Bacteroidales bacterium]|nr:hypothetical protein [Bacteroidales bacterium]